MGADNEGTDFNFLIVNDENGGVLDLFKFLAWNDPQSRAKFLERCGGLSEFAEEQFGEERERETIGHRWVIVLSIIVRKILKFIGKPMSFTGNFVEFLLNLLHLNLNFLGLLCRFIHGNVLMPKRDSKRFISTIGHLDGRVDIVNVDAFSQDFGQPEAGNRALMDLCMMASKLAYENAKVVKNIVNRYWKMHFVGFYNCWNEYQKENSTQVFIACDKPRDANLILISFRGTELFDADDWITDFDYSWYEIPKIGKVHMGFLEALGLGSRANTSTFSMNLLSKNPMPSHSNDGTSQSMDSSESGKEIVPEIRDMTTAYYTVRNKLTELLEKHKNAKFMVTGHSLGGALAILFPIVLVLHNEVELMQQLEGVYTFGQPRVGNGQLCRYMEAHLEHPESKYFRVVYCNDIIPRLPYDDNTFLYKHFGSCLYYNSLYVEKDVDEEPNRNFSLRYMIPVYANSLWEMLRGMVMGYIFGPDYKESWESILLRIVGLAMPGLSAHSPVNYVNCIRLGRKERRRAVEIMSL